MERWSRSGVAFLVVAVLASGCYLNTLGGIFIIDDYMDIVHNPILRQPLRHTTFFTTPFRGKGDDVYRPITNLNYWVDIRLYGLNPFGFHLENIMWHTAMALLVLVLLRGLWPAEPLLAFGAAALFAVHPVHTEAVSYISGRSDVLAAFWGLLAFWAHRRADREGSPASLWRAAALAVWLVALGAKEMAATVPLLLLMTDALLDRPSGWWRPGQLATRYGPYVVAGVAYVAFRLSVLGLFGPPESSQIFSGALLSVRGATMLKVGAAYVGRLLFPVNLTLFWAVPHASGLTDGALPLLALALLVALVGLAWAVRRKAPPVAWGILWSGLALLPVSNLIPIGEQGAERFLYLPSVGACVALAWVMTRLVKPLKKDSSRAPIPLAGALGCAVLVLFAVNTIDRNQDWLDELAFWEKTVHQSPKNNRAVRNLLNVMVRKGRYAEARSFFQRSLEIWGKTDPNSPSLALGLNNLAWSYYKQGQYAEAEPLYKRALAIREKALGPNHPDVAESLNNQAELYHAQGRYVEAEPLYKRSLAIREKALGPHHPSVAVSLNNLGKFYQAQGQYTEAEPLYKRALAIREEALGSDHPDVAQSLNNQATLYYEQGRYAKAGPLYKRALAVDEEAFGPDHPGVAADLNNLAVLYDTQGQYTKARPLYKRSLAIREKALGPDHPDVAQSLNNLAALYHTQGRYVEAEPLYKRALAIREKALGPDHPDVAESLNNQAVLYYEQGRYAKAEPLYKRALAIDEEAFGPDHPGVATDLNNQAELYHAQGRYAKAEPLYKRSLAIREKALGPDHPDVAESLNNQAELYRAQGRYAKAEPLYKRALGIIENTVPNHPNVATTLERMAELYTKMGREDEGERLLKRAKRIRAMQ